MNIVLIIKTDDVNDIPSALERLARSIKDDIRIMGHRANAIGVDYTRKEKPFDFDYQIENDNLNSLADWNDKMYNEKESKLGV
jgi:hypothetical protein